jgi:hypothetical protein
MGTLNMLGLAKRTKARFLISSTSGMIAVSFERFLYPLRFRGLWRP